MLAKLRRWLGLAPRWDIFISHAAEDSAAGQAVARACTARGLSPWLDDHRLRFGDPFDTEILKAVKDSSVFLLLLTEHALKSRYVSFETSVAIAYGVRVIPVFLEKIDTTTLEVPFDRAAKRQGHSLTSPPSPEGCLEVADGVTRMLSRLRVSALVLRAAILLLAAGLAWPYIRSEPPPLLSTALMAKRPGAESLAQVFPEAELPTGSSLVISAQPEAIGHLFMFWVENGGKRIQRIFPPTQGSETGKALLDASKVRAGNVLQKEPPPIPPEAGKCALAILFVKESFFSKGEPPDDNSMAGLTLEIAYRAEKAGGGGLKGIGNTPPPLSSDELSLARAALAWKAQFEKGFRRGNVAVSVHRFTQIPPEAPPGTP